MRRPQFRAANVVNTFVHRTVVMSAETVKHVRADSMAVSASPVTPSIASVISGSRYTATSPGKGICSPKKSFMQPSFSQAQRARVTIPETTDL